MGLLSITYLPIQFYIAFKHPVCADTHPLFVFRSMLGKNLHSMCCIAHSSTCSECMYNKTCAYAYIFETILPQGNEVKPGCDRASHPFAFSHETKINKIGQILTQYVFTITLFGKAVEYLPYIYAAFVRSGIDGVFKSRIPFTVADVMVDGKSILQNAETIQTDIAPHIWQFQDETKELSKEITPNVSQETASKMESSAEVENNILVELISPLRFKTQGRYTKDFDAASFMLCLFRRIKTLCLLYGQGDVDMRYPIEKMKLSITDRNLTWNDYSHYSARQKNAMELGGSVGSFKLKGHFTDLDKALLDFATIANAGKNTNFGLGQINVWKQW